jgi:hypothetical protein
VEVNGFYRPRSRSVRARIAGSAGIGRSIFTSGVYKVAGLVAAFPKDRGPQRAPCWLDGVKVKPHVGYIFQYTVEVQML